MPLGHGGGVARRKTRAHTYWEIMGQTLLVNALVLLQEHTDDEPIHLCQGESCSPGTVCSPKCTHPCRVSTTLSALFTSGDLRIHCTIYRRGSGSLLPISSHDKPGLGSGLREGRYQPTTSTQR